MFDCTQIVRKLVPILSGTGYPHGYKQEHKRIVLRLLRKLHGRTLTWIGEGYSLRSPEPRGF